MRYIGIDYGIKRVGLALSDEEGRVAFPHGIVPNDETLLPALLSLVEEKGVGAVVVGESRDLKGAENPLMTKIRTFAQELGRESGLPIHFEQEFFTSAAAVRPLGGEQKPSARSVRREAKEGIDAAAAALILQSYLGRIKR